MNIRNLLDQHQQNNPNNGNNQNGNNNNNNANQGDDVEGGMGLFGPRLNGGGNAFERGGFWVFKILQLFILWQLIQFIFNYISQQHIIIITIIVVAYLGIDYLQKNRNNQRREEPRN